MRPTDLCFRGAKTALQDAVAGKHDDDRPWEIIDLRGDRYQSSALNSLCAREKRSPGASHKLVLMSADLSFQTLFDTTRAARNGVTIAMTARRPARYRLAQGVQFESATRRFEYRATRSWSGAFRLEKRDPEMSQVPTPAELRAHYAKGGHIHDI
ncbi:hypothetical protein AYJ57_21445 (plasmid) [Salipiger sp. CCB-MM3]|nr:hypothetical protein AYJ57_21445 [Salipiger sp. CCB-MM3]